MRQATGSYVNKIIRLDSRQGARQSHERINMFILSQLCRPTVNGLSWTLGEWTNDIKWRYSHSCEKFKRKVCGLSTNSQPTANTVGRQSVDSSNAKSMPAASPELKKCRGPTDQKKLTTFIFFGSRMRCCFRYASQFRVIYRCPIDTYSSLLRNYVQLSPHAIALLSKGMILSIP
jgi:hypothetical protein